MPVHKPKKPRRKARGAAKKDYRGDWQKFLAGEQLRLARLKEAAKRSGLDYSRLIRETEELIKKTKEEEVADAVPG